MSKYIWPIKIKATTRHASGRKLSISKTVEGAGDMKTAVLNYFKGKPNLSDWLGVDITVMWPTSYGKYVLDYDKNHELALLPN